MIKSREYQRALLQAMGVPAELCSDVQVDFPFEDTAKVVVTYLADPEWFKKAAEILANEDQRTD